MDGPGPPSGEGPAVLAIDGPVERADIPRLCRRLRRFLDDVRTDLVVCDVKALVDPDAATIDALARLQLTARRRGCRVRLIYACPELRDLLEVMGLRDVVPLERLPVEARGQAEEWEEPSGVEEEGDPGDAIA